MIEQYETAARTRATQAWSRCVASLDKRPNVATERYRRFGVNGDRALVADRRALNVQFWFMLQMAYLSEEDGSAGR